MARQLSEEIPIAVLNLAALRSTYPTFVCNAPAHEISHIWSPAFLELANLLPMKFLALKSRKPCNILSPVFIYVVVLNYF